MKEDRILEIIKDLERLKLIKGEPFSKIKYKNLKKELLNICGENLKKIENYVLVRSYVNKDISKPYISIYTEDSYNKRMDFLNNKIK